MPSLPKMRGADLAGGTKEELVLMYKLGLATALFVIFSALAKGIRLVTVPGCARLVS